MSPLIDLIGSAKGYGWGALASSDNWLVNFDSADTDYMYNVTSDDAGYIYGVGSTGNGGFITKLNNNGDVQWQKKLTLQSGGMGHNHVYANSSNVIWAGRNSTAESAFVIKLDTSGSIIWQRQLSLGGGQVVWVYSSVVDSSDNVYVTGISTPGGVESGFVVKLNSSGTIQWQKHFNAGSGQTDTYDIKLDSGGNVLISGRTTEGGGYSMLLVKYNSSGTLQWQRRLSGVNSLFGFAVAVDSTDNVYFGGRNTANGGDLQLVKYNSSGTLQWQKKLGGADGENFKDMTIDSSGNLYISGVDITATQYLLFAKYNSSGTLQWQRKLTSGAEISEAYINIFNATHFAFNIFQTAVFGKLPTDGSKTGSYTLNGNTYVYAAHNLTDGTTSWTTQAAGLTHSEGTVSIATPTHSIATSTLTRTIVSI